MKTEQLGTGDIGKTFFLLAVPSILAQIVTVIYNIVDRVFIGQLPNGRPMLAAIGLSAPVTLLITAFTALLGSSGAPLCAIHLGKNERFEADRIMSNSFGALMISGVILMVVCFSFCRPIMAIFGAEAETLEYALRYLRIYILGTLFVQISVGMNAYINAQGHAKAGMCTVVAGALLNVILDPVMIYWLDMGVTGAATATVISQGVSAALVLGFLLSSKSELRLRPAYMRPRWELQRRIMLLGVSPFIMKLTESLLSAAFNVQLQRYGGELAVSIMTSMNSIWQMAQLATHGFTEGAQPILGYNYGAGKYARVRAAFRLDLMTCWGWTFLCAVAVMAVPGLFLRMFTSDSEALAVGCPMLRIYFFGMFCYGAFNACQQAYIALGNAKLSLFFAVFRKLLLLIPLIYALPALFPSHPVWAVLMAEPAADILSTAANGIVFRRFFNQRLQSAA